MKHWARAALLIAILATLCAQGADKPTALIAIGRGAKADRGDGVAIGMYAKSERGDGVAIGKKARATGYAKVAGGGGHETTAVGPDALAAGWRCTSIGARSISDVVSATALGRGTVASGPHMIAIGRGAYMEKIAKSPELNRQNGCGIAGDSLWLGGMMCHRLIDRTRDTYIHEKRDGGDGKKRWHIRTFKPRTYTIHGMDAYDARFDQDPKRFNAKLYDPKDPKTWTHRVDKDVAGGNLHLEAGRGTGTADGGDIELRTAAAGKVSRNRKNPARPALRVDTDYATKNATPMLLWDNNTGKLKRVLVGPPDSGGKGFRALVIEN